MKSLAMNNLFFKSRTGLIKNSSENLADLIEHQFEIVKTQLRAQRDDLLDINKKLQKIMIDKHLQMQVDNYFEDKPEDDSN